MVEGFVNKPSAIGSKSLLAMESTTTYDLDQVLYKFNGIEPFTTRNAVEGVQIFGGIGSGKTSGSGKALAHAYLRAGFGGLVLCAKKSELDTWREYITETGRLKSLLIFDASGRYRFPFLQYEISRAGAGSGLTSNLVKLFTSVYETMDRSKGGGTGNDPYWLRSMSQLLRNAIDLLLIANNGEVTVPLLYKVISSAPRSEAERDSETWKAKSFCWKLIFERGMSEETFDQWEQHDFKSTLDYWLEEFPTIPPKTRASIISMFSSMAIHFMRRPFRMLFAENPESEKQILLPEHSHNGAIIILNLPVKEWGEAGRAAQVIYKQLWQAAAERRNFNEHSRPIFLWADEAQNFISESDMQFQATARSSGACTVYISQNEANFYAEMGGEHSKYRVNSLLGNLQTRIWHANSDPQTNERAAEIIGKSWQRRHVKSDSVTAHGFSLGQSEQIGLDYDIIPKKFTKLKKGGKPNNLKVEAYIFQAGREWSNGKTYFKAIFKQ